MPTLHWYCPHCGKLPQFKKGKVKQKETITKAEQRAITLDKVCTCQAPPQPSERLLECHSVNCQDGLFFFHINVCPVMKKPHGSVIDVRQIMFLFLQYNKIV